MSLSTAHQRHLATPTVTTSTSQVLGGVDSRRASMPLIVSNLATVAAIWCLLSLIVQHRHSPVILTINAVFLAGNIPVGPTILDAVIWLVIALAASTRKRIAVWALTTIVVMSGLVSVLQLLFPDDPELFVYDTRWRTVFAVISVIAAVLEVAALMWGKRAFPGRITRGSAGGALAILVVGLAANTVLGFVLTMFTRTGRAGDLATWIFSRVFGRLVQELILSSPSVTGPRWLGFSLSFISGVVVAAAILYFLRGQRMPGRSPADDLLVRTLLARFGGDSLGYFATREDRSLAASPDGQAGVSYGVAMGVAVAAGDPLGDPAHWDQAVTTYLQECATHGWMSAALSVSEAGARVYRANGFVVRSMGDEAVIHTSRFDINAPQMRPLAQSVRRARRAGLTISIRRQSDIPDAELRELAQAIEHFRVGEERGFSMSLERVLEPSDGRMMVVDARDRDGNIQAVLTFSPWGSKDLSLTLMRRSPTSLNGIIEAMMVALIEFGQAGAVDRISLNFAMFRKIFDEGVAVDASLMDRFLRRVMMGASKVWQLDSLYQSNARYQPEWVPRYLCYQSLPQATVVLVACGVLEGFLPQLGRRTWQQWEPSDQHLAKIHDIEQATVRRALEQAVAGHKLSEQESIRRSKAEKLASLGREPWPAGVSLGTLPSQVLHDIQTHVLTDGDQVNTGGRIRAIRDHGKLVFVDVERQGQIIQVVLDCSQVGQVAFDQFSLVDLGDLVAFDGLAGFTRTGEASVFATSWTMAAKTLRTLPSMGTVLDAKTRARQRVTHLLTDPGAVALLRTRAQAVTSIRKFLGEREFLEVETPMLHAIKGGANARPFITHFNAYGTDVFLRIAPELYLKRLAVAGMDAIFEMGRSFRNEGADATHNPEFTSLEAYRAGWDYQDMRQLTQELIQNAATAIHGKPVCWRPKGSPGTEGLPVVDQVDGQDMVAVDISGTWSAITVHDAISQAVGQSVTPATGVQELTAIARRHGVPVPNTPDRGALIGALYDELVEARTVTPTFYMDFPRSSSPLTRVHRQDATLAERWDLVAFGMELGTAYTELTDPVDQRDRFMKQSIAAAAGDPEAMSIDRVFLDDLELGLAPTGGLGLGVDRLVMALTGTTIRQVLAFPFVRPEN